jgi:hypothetical protein
VDAKDSVTGTGSLVSGNASSPVIVPANVKAVGAAVGRIQEEGEESIDLDVDVVAVRRGDITIGTGATSANHIVNTDLGSKILVVLDGDVTVTKTLTSGTPMIIVEGDVTVTTEAQDQAINWFIGGGLDAKKLPTTGTLNVVGDATFADTVTGITGAIDIGGDATFDKALTLSANLIVGGTAEFKDTVTRTSGALIFGGDVTLTKNKALTLTGTDTVILGAGRNINGLEDLLGALRDRIAFFDTAGCRASDHALEYPPFKTAAGDDFHEAPIDTGRWEKEVKDIFAAALAGQVPDIRETESWKTFLLNFLGEEYADRDWAMQIHLAALRNANSRAFQRLGPDTGYDAVHDHPAAANLARLLDLLESRGKLPRMILYSLNIKDMYTLGTIMGCFQGGGVPGKMQLGSGWWFLDHIDGMEAQMKILGNTGLLSRFVGMLTDSRSFLSYPRHEYFRRVLCNILGNWAENGEIPMDFRLLAGMVKDISFGNAERYFGHS